MAAPAGSSKPSTIDADDAAPLPVNAMRFQPVWTGCAERFAPVNIVTVVAAAARTHALRQIKYPPGAASVCVMLCAPVPEFVRCQALVPPAGSVTPPVLARKEQRLHTGFSRWPL